MGGIDDLSFAIIWLSFLLGKRLTTMSRHFKIITKEVGRDNHIETEFIGDVDRAYLIEFFGLREPDVEWFRIEEVQKDWRREPQNTTTAGECQPLVDNAFD